MRFCEISLCQINGVRLSRRASVVSVNITTQHKQCGELTLRKSTLDAKFR
jgi:hypothetical protein